MKDMSGLDQRDTLQDYSDKRCGKLPTSPIREEAKQFKGLNKALKVFEKEAKCTTK